MKTGKLPSNPYPTYHNKNDKKNVCPSIISEKHRNYWWKTSLTRQEQYTFTRSNTHEQYLFGAIHYDIHLDMKLDYTISRIFQEMSLSELETLHHL